MRISSSNNPINVAACMVGVLIFSVCAVSAFAHNKVVVVPLGADEKTLSTETSISIPVGALRNTMGGFGTHLNGGPLNLEASGNTSFGTTFVVPADHAPGTLIFVDILVVNPGFNGLCRAVIESNIGVRYRDGTIPDNSGEFGFERPGIFFPEGGVLHCLKPTDLAVMPEPGIPSPLEYFVEVTATLTHALIS